MPFITLCQSGFVTRCEFFYANDMPCTVPIPYQKTLLPNRSSFLLNGYLYWPNSLSKKHLPSKFDLFSANYILFTSPILYQKSSVAPYELFLLITCSSLTPFTAIKALLPHKSYIMLITCDVLAPFSIKKANCMALLPEFSITTAFVIQI